MFVSILGKKFMITLGLFTLLLPLLSFLILIFGQNKIKKGGGLCASMSIFLSFILANIIFFSQVYTTSEVLLIFPIANFIIDVNPLSAMMLFVVTFISFLVHIFSITYMKEEEGYNRYFAYLGLFSFSMLGIVLSDNLLFIYIFWELVGLSSYLLIGFWYQKKSAVLASKKAFIVNRVGDFGLLIGVLLIYVHFETLNIAELSQIFEDSLTQSPNHSMIIFMGLCLFAGVLGKSAQFPLHIWLPDAMEGPTPVSALIHAATMVVAGVFLLGRIYFIIYIEVLIVITFIGTITTFIAGFSAMAQQDIKKVLAYSTISQIAYMVLGMGVGAYQASLFHLFTHAFFKAGLFLGAGAIIHTLHEVAQKHQVHFDAQDMFLMGNLRQKMPFVFYTFLVCALALAGLPLFTGFLSKDAIILTSLAWANEMSQNGNFIFYLVPTLAFLTAFLTAFYVARMLFLVFFGENKLKIKFPENSNLFADIKDVNLWMKIPLGILAFFSLFFVFSFNPFELSPLLLGIYVENLEVKRQFLPLENIESLTHQWHIFTLLISLSLAFAGFFLGFILTKKYETRNPIPKALLLLSKNAFYIDQFFHLIFVKGIVKLAQLFAHFDKKFVDGFVNFLPKFYVVLSHIVAWFDRFLLDGFVNFLAYLSKSIGNVTRSLQSGKVQNYFAVAILAFLFIIWWVFF